MYLCCIVYNREVSRYKIMIKQRADNGKKKTVDTTKLVQDAMKNGFMHSFGTSDEKRREIIINDIDTLREKQVECYEKSFSQEILVSDKIGRYNREHGDKMKDQFENFKNEVNNNERDKSIVAAKKILVKVTDECEKIHDEWHYPIRG